LIGRLHLQDRDKAVRRRDLLLAGAAFAFGNVLEDPQSVAYSAAPDTTSTPFSSQTVRQLAR